MGPSAERPLLPANRELVRGLGVVAAFVLVAYLVILARDALLEGVRAPWPELHPPTAAASTTATRAVRARISPG